MTLAPRRTISPASPAATSLPPWSTRRSSNVGRAQPTVVAIVSASSSGAVPAAVPPSVSPYPEISTRYGSSSKMRRISATGISAAPIVAVRKLERS